MRVAASADDDMSSQSEGLDQSLKSPSKSRQKKQRSD